MMQINPQAGCIKCFASEENIVFVVLDQKDFRNAGFRERFNFHGLPQKT
jgi:hypothetical protein